MGNVPSVNRRHDRMSGASERLAHKISSAGDLSSVVRSMKAVAASSVGQYERAVESLRDYLRTVEFALSVALRGVQETPLAKRPRKLPVGVIIIGADQGLVGRFNEILMEFLVPTLHGLVEGVGRVWAVGARIAPLVVDHGLPAAASLPAPYSVEAITPLIGRLLSSIAEARSTGRVDEVLVFHTEPLGGSRYRPMRTRVLPLDTEWRHTLTDLRWPTTAPAEVIGGCTAALPSLIRSHLFATLFQACAQSLASENASRLAAMQRAEENIADMLVELRGQFHRLRQAAIDEELFEVVSGYDAITPPRRMAGALLRS